MNQEALFVSYGLALLFTIAAVVLGLLAYRKNGESRSFAYSALVESFQEDRLNLGPPNVPRKLTLRRP
jgi:hypothetical protein